MKPTDNQPVIVTVPPTTVSRCLEASENVENEIQALDDLLARKAFTDA